MKTIITLNGVKVTKDIPTTWHGVTFRNLIGLINAGEDAAKIISVFTEIDPETIKKASIKNFDVLVSLLAFRNKEMDLVIPNFILGHNVPRFLEDEAAARYADLQDIIAKFKEGDNINNLSLYPLIVATYVTRSPYDFKNAEALTERLWNAPCMEVMAIGNFTLLKFRASKDGMLNSYHREDTPLNRLRQAMINYIRRLAFSIRCGIWRMQLPSHVRRYLNGQ